jgi:hypothetical protein
MAAKLIYQHKKNKIPTSFKKKGLAKSCFFLKMYSRGPLLCYYINKYKSTDKKNCRYLQTESKSKLAKSCWFLGKRTLSY